MERLTRRSDTGHAYYPRCFEEPCGGDGCKIKDCLFDITICERLAKYEETGLEPEEVISMQAAKVALEASDAPAANAVAVVLCKDCKSCRKLNRKDRIEEAYADGVLWCTNQSDGVWPDDFCSYGERRGGGEDG